MKKKIKKSLIEYYEVSPLCFSPSELTNMGPDVTVLRAMCEVCVFPHHIWLTSLDGELEGVCLQSQDNSDKM